MTAPLEKGNALEFAVRAVEIAILKTSPALKENRFLIESKKIITVAGVRHEVDILVEVDLGRGYKSAFIFECKNWEAKVSKNEIIVFSEKIKALQAQKGFFVAKSFTSDAEAQAEIDPRLVLHRATERENTPTPFDVHFVEVCNKHADLKFFETDATEALESEAADLNSAEIYFMGQRLDVQGFVNDWVNELSEETLKTFPSGMKPEGEYELQASGERVYRQGELRIRGREFVRCTADALFTVKVVRPPMISDFEIESRGRVLSLAPVSSGDGHIHMSFVAISNGEDAP